MIYRIISADSHIDLGIMPPDVFVSRCATALEG